MAIVYRLEHGKIGYGPFRICEALSKHNFQHLGKMFWKLGYHLAYNGPATQFDSVAYDCKGFQSEFDVCGATTLEMLLSWFPNDKKTMRWLHRAGFKVRSYDVPDDDDVKRGKHQIAFCKADATLIDEKNLLTLIN